MNNPTPPTGGVLTHAPIEGLPTMATKKQEMEAEENGLSLMSMDKVKARKPDWLWPGRIAFGTLTILEGRKGEGKSTVAAAVVADVTGGPRLNEGKRRFKGGALWLTKEENIAVAVKPRLKAAGAKDKHCWFPNAKGSSDVSEPLVFPKDLGELEKIIKKTKIRVIVIDPISSFVDGNVDTNN